MCNAIKHTIKPVCGSNWRPQALTDETRLEVPDKARKVSHVWPGQPVCVCVIQLNLIPRNDDSITSRDSFCAVDSGGGVCELLLEYYPVVPQFNLE